MTVLTDSRYAGLARSAAAAMGAGSPDVVRGILAQWQCEGQSGWPPARNNPGNIARTARCRSATSPGTTAPRPMSSAWPGRASAARWGTSRPGPPRDGGRQPGLVGRSPRKLAWIKATHLPDQTRHESSFHEWVRKHKRSLPNDGSRKVVTVRRYQRQMEGHSMQPRYVVVDIGDGDQVVAELDRHGRGKRIVRGYESKRDRRKQFRDLRTIL